MTRSIALALTLVLGLALVACGVAGEPVSSDIAALTEDSGEASDAGDSTSALLALPLQPISSPEQIASPEAAAETAASAPSFFKPAGCATRSRSGNVATFELKGCTGPFGLVGVNGKLVATFTKSATPGTLDVSEKSEGLVVGKTPIEQSATGTITFSGTKRVVSWKGTYSGISARKSLPISHQGSYTGVYDAATGCLELDGSATTQIGNRGVSTTTTGYKRCSGVCPEAGTITATGLLNKLTVKVTYLGAGLAELALPSGKVFDYTMGWCAAQ